MSLLSLFNKPYTEHKHDKKGSTLHTLHLHAAEESQIIALVRLESNQIGV